MDHKNNTPINLFNPRHIANLALVSLAVLLHAADATSVATLVPAIVQDIGGVELIPWAVSLYEIGTILAGAACGFLTMNYGLKKPMFIATLLFSAGCITSYLALDMWIVLLGRLFQGMGGGGLVALSFVAVNVLFHRSLTPRVLAVVSVIWGASAFIGPLIGGLFVEYLTWRYAFLFFAFISLVLACLLLVIVKDDFRFKASQSNRFPIFRLLVLTIGIVSIAYAGVDVSVIKTTSFILIGGAFLFYFFHVDSNHDESRLFPKKPISLSNRVGAGLTMLICFTISTIAITVYGPYLVTKIHGVSLLIAGYIVACSSIGWSIAAIVCSKINESADRRMIILGMSTLTISIVGFIFSVPSGPIWLIALFAFLEGCGFGIAYAFILRLITNETDETERVSAAIPTVQRLGYAIGAAYVGIVANAVGISGETSREALADVAFWTFASCLPIALLGLIAMFRFVKHGDY